MSKPTFNYADPFLMDGQLTETERMVRDTAHAYAQDKLAPRVQNAFRHEHTDREIFNEMGALGLLGALQHAAGQGGRHEGGGHAVVLGLRGGVRGAVVLEGDGGNRSHREALVRQLAV